MEYQTYGVDAAGKMVHCGPITCARMSKRVAERGQRAWEDWREKYIAENPSCMSAPIVTDHREVVAWIAHPIGKPGKAKRYEIPPRVKQSAA